MLILNIIAILVGIIAGYMLFSQFNIVYRGPNSAHIKNTIYKKNNKCYRFVPCLYLCP